MDRARLSAEYSYAQLKCIDRDSLIAEHQALLPDLNGMDASSSKAPNQVSREILAKLQDNADDLNPANQVHIIELLKMSMEPVYGKFLLCRTIVPPVKILALSTVVEDPEGKYAARLSIHNIAKIIGQSCTLELAQSLFQVGTILAIKDPWLKQTHDGGFSIRCDNPANLVVFDASTIKEFIPNVTWNGN